MTLPKVEKFPNFWWILLRMSYKDSKNPLSMWKCIEFHRTKFKIALQKHISLTKVLIDVNTFWKIDFNVVDRGECTYFDAMTSPRYIIYGHEIVRWNFYGTIFACFAYVRARKYACKCGYTANIYTSFTGAWLEFQNWLWTQPGVNRV